MINNESSLEKYFRETSCLLSIMDKEEALDFFQKYTFNKDDILITTMTDDEIDELYSDDSDAYLYDFEDAFLDNEIEYSENIIEDILMLEDDTKLYLDFEPDAYYNIYTKMMREKIFENNNDNKTEIFLELINSYSEYLKLPKKYKRVGQINNISNFTTNDFINKFIRDKDFSNHILLAYNCLSDYNVTIEIFRIKNSSIKQKEVNSINDIVRMELVNLYDKILKETGDRINTFETIYNKLSKNKGFYTRFFDNAKTHICSSDYAKILIMNDCYLMSKSILSDNNIIDTDNTIINIYDGMFGEELIKQFNSDKSFALRAFLLFIDFNQKNHCNKDKFLMKSVYGDEKILRKINKLHFLDYISSDKKKNS